MNQYSNSKQEFLIRLDEIININLADEHFGVSELAGELGMSRANLHRKVTMLLGTTVSRYIRQKRLGKGHDLLQHTNLKVSEVAYQVGFSSVTYFIKCFHDYFGYSPGEVLRRNVTVESSQDLNQDEQISPKPSNKKRKAVAVSMVFFLVLVAVVIFIQIKPIAFQQKEPEKSIAVLPFRNDSTDEENDYFFNGIMADLILDLQAIKALRVLGWTSTEKYRNNPMPIQEIASEMNVAFIVEASGLQYGDMIRLRVQLLEGATGQGIWSNSYDELINEPEDITRIQSHIAKSIANQLQAVITPEESEIIEKVPTGSMTAYYFYQRGREEYEKYLSVYQGYFSRENNREALEKAEYLFNKALEYDSTFAMAYTQLAMVYAAKNYWETFLTENFLDTILALANKALSYDDQLAEAYSVKGYYYERHNQFEQALTEYDRAIDLNPNDWVAYYSKCIIYENSDFVKAINNIQKAILVYQGPNLPNLYQEIGSVYGWAGFKERYRYYAKEAFKLDGDSAGYYHDLAFSESWVGNFKKGIEYEEKAYAIDSTRYWVLLNLGVSYSFLDQYEESLSYLLEYDKIFKVLDNPDPIGTFRVGHALWVNGFKDKAEIYFNTALDFLNKAIDLGRIYVLDDYYNLAGIHSFLGDKEKAFEYLGLFKRELKGPFFYIEYLKKDPLFDNLRDEPEFQQIIRELEARYLAEHEKVRKWMEESELL